MQAPTRSNASERPAAHPQSGDFQRLRASGAAPGLSLRIGAAFCAARDGVAQALIRLGVTPNHLTVAGFVATCGAGFCLARGASAQVPYFYAGSGPVGWWPTAAAALLVLAGAMDMLDGAVARVGKLHSRFGAILDSTLDRFSDLAIFLGCAVHFALTQNLTLQILTFVAVGNVFMISYVKARAEDLIEDCSVGYWLRGERCAAVLIGCATGHVPAVLWLLALLNPFTVLRRLDYARRAIAALESSAPPPARGPEPGWRGVCQLWRHPRGSAPYDVVTGLNIAYIVVVPCFVPALLGCGTYADPLRVWLNA